MAEQPMPGGDLGPTSIPPRTWREFRDSGLLWYINKVAFHPRGLALALYIDRNTGVCDGWTILGDGSSVWEFVPGDDDDGFAKFNQFLADLAENG